MSCRSSVTRERYELSLSTSHTHTHAHMCLTSVPRQHALTAAPSRRVMDEPDAARQRNGPAAGARMHGLFTDTDTGRLTVALTLSDSCLTVQSISCASAPEHLDLRDCLGSRAHRGEREEQGAQLCVYFYAYRRRWMASGPVRQRDERRFRLALGTEESDEDASLREAERWARAINAARRPEHTHGEKPT